MNENTKKDNRGYLYPNNNKNKPTQPDFTGKVTIENKEWRLSAWENVSPDGKKYLSINVSLPLEKDSNAPKQKGDENAPKSQSEMNKQEIDELNEILKLTDENPFE